MIMVTMLAYDDLASYVCRSHTKLGVH